MSDIREIKPGQYDDPVENLARAIQEVSLIASEATGFVITCKNGKKKQGHFDSLSPILKSFRREQARLLLDRLHR